MTDNTATDPEKINLLWKKFNTATNVNQNSDEFGGELLQFKNTFSVDYLLNKSVPNIINVTPEQLSNTDLSGYIIHSGASYLTIDKLDSFFEYKNMPFGYSLDLSFLNLPLKYYYRQVLKTVNGINNLYSFSAVDSSNIAEGQLATKINSGEAVSIMNNIISWSKDLASSLTYQYKLYYTMDAFSTTSISYNVYEILMFSYPTYWILDNKNGIIEFYGGEKISSGNNIKLDIQNGSKTGGIITYTDWTSSSATPNKSPPFFSYIRYIGDTGFDNLEMSGNIVIDGSLNINGNLNISGGNIFIDGNQVNSGGNVNGVSDWDDLSLSNLDLSGNLRFKVSDTSYITIKAPDTIDNSYTLTLPISRGNSGEYLSVDENGQLSFNLIPTTDLTGLVLEASLNNFTYSPSFENVTISGDLIFKLSNTSYATLNSYIYKDESIILSSNTNYFELFTQFNNRYNGIIFNYLNADGSANYSMIEYDSSKNFFIFYNDNEYRHSNLKVNEIIANNIKSQLLKIKKSDSETDTSYINIGYNDEFEFIEFTDSGKLSNFNINKLFANNGNFTFLKIKKSNSESDTSYINIDYNHDSSAIEIRENGILSNLKVNELNGNTGNFRALNIKYENSDISYITVIAAEELDNSYTLILPTRQGNSGEYLLVDGSGQLRFDNIITTNRLVLEASLNNFTYSPSFENLSISTSLKANDASFSIVDISNSLSIYNDVSFINLSNNQVPNAGQIREINIVGSGGASDISINNIGQSFYEIMTQQPNKFDSFENPIPTTSTIQISWTYDNIIAQHIGTSINASLTFPNSIKERNLPYIDQIKLDISGIGNSGLTGWIPYQTITIPFDVSYNQNLYKTHIINKNINTNPTTDISYILSKLTPFDIRIYGVNYAENVPSIYDRSLYFNNIAFNRAFPPSQPIFNNITINNNSSLILKYEVLQTDSNDISSSARLNYYIIDYSQNETLASIIYPVNSINIESSGTLPNIANEQFFNINLLSLRSGTKYNYSLAVRNNLNDSSFSLYSDPSVTPFTQLPNSKEVKTSLNLQINPSSYTYISTSLLTNESKIYINLSDNTKHIIPNDEEIQSIEISKPYFDGQQLQDFGYGKFIDNSLNLVNLTVSINNTEKQKITFDGSFSKTTGNNEKLNDNNFNYILLESGTSLEDIWNGNIGNQGFRLKGLLKLNQISNSDISSVIGDPSINPYILNYNYQRHTDMGGSNQDVSYNIYVDDLSLNPTRSGTNETSVNSVLYNFGIPSVQQFSLKFFRIYNNINSPFMYLPGNLKIADVNQIPNTSASSTIKDILLSISDISSSGSYSFNNNNFDIKTSNYYNSLNYTSSRFTPGDSNNISWNENVYNLLNPNGIPNSLSHITNHYVDYNSFLKSGSRINNQNFNLTTTPVYEISNISLLGSNLGGLQLEHYDDHNKQIKEYTLLNIDNKFQSNRDFSFGYPNITDFSYNGSVSITNDFSAGLISYDFYGNKTSNNSGYKWIVFKFNKSHVTPSDIANSIPEYLDICSLLKASPYNFSDTELQELKKNGSPNGIFNSYNNKVIGFVQHNDGTTNRIGRLDTPFYPDPNNIWFNRPSNFSYNTIFTGNDRQKYGSIVNYNTSDTNWGPIINLNQNTSNDIYIYIGFLNTYVDSNSLIGPIINTSNNILFNKYVYQISNISLFSHNLAGLQIENYNNNIFKYDLNGNKVINTSGYRWFVFKFNLDNVIKSSPPYLNIYNLLQKDPYNISSTNLKELKKDGSPNGIFIQENNKVVGFVQHNDGTTNRIGRLDTPFYADPNNLWFKRPSNFSYNIIFNGNDRQKYGSIVNYSNNNNWGPLINLNGSNNIYIYLGFYNDYNN